MIQGMQTNHSVQTMQYVQTRQTVQTLPALQTHILDIPSELVVQILNRLQFKDLYSLELTSAYFRL